MVIKSRKQILRFSFEPKNELKYFCISALASKIGQIKKMEALYTANWRILFCFSNTTFLIWPLFRGYGRNTKNIVVCFKFWFWNLLTFSKADIQHLNPLEFFVKVWLAISYVKWASWEKPWKVKHKQTYTNSNYFLTSSAYKEVDNFQKVSAVHHLMEKLDQFSKQFM